MLIFTSGDRIIINRSGTNTAQLTVARGRESRFRKSYPLGTTDDQKRLSCRRRGAGENLVKLGQPSSALMSRFITWGLFKGCPSNTCLFATVQFLRARGLQRTLRAIASGDFGHGISLRFSHPHNFGMATEGCPIGRRARARTREWSWFLPSASRASRE